MPIWRSGIKTDETQNFTTSESMFLVTIEETTRLIEYETRRFSSTYTRSITWFARDVVCLYGTS